MLLKAFLLASACLFINAAAQAAGPGEAEPSQSCVQAIHQAEGRHSIPRALLQSIGVVESGRTTSTGSKAPWPWSVNANGTSAVYASKEQAVAAVEALQKAGTRVIDVGCMQVNLFYHPEAFANLSEAFDPATNASFAGRFLAHLHKITGTWPKAAAGYHSLNPERSASYGRRVMDTWGQPTEELLPITRPDLVVPELAAQVAAVRVALAQLAPPRAGRAIAERKPAARLFAAIAERSPERQRPPLLRVRSNVASGGRNRS